MIASYLLRRAIGFVFVLFGLSLIIFVVARVVPGDPARISLGPQATQEQVAQLREEMGFNKPATVPVSRLCRRCAPRQFRPVFADQPAGLR
jgi:ABC-type dipeptide/oligopeptide/nickel transport system permease component